MTSKMIIVDANILMRAVLGVRVLELIMEFTPTTQFFAPAICFDDARYYLPSILTKRGVDVSLAMRVLSELEKTFQIIQEDELHSLEKIARTRLRQRDENDWPILAAALLLNCPIWTEDQDFFGVGVATWTTANVRLFLEG